MSGPAVMIAVKFISTMYALKTAADGVREGNLAKAVIGGVAAYFGANSFGTEAAAAQAGETAASQNASELGTTAGDAAAKSAMTEGAKEATTEGLGTGASQAAQGSRPMWSLENEGMKGSVVATEGAGTTQAPYLSGQGPTSPPPTTPPAGGEEGFMGWFNKHPQQAYGLMQTGGTLLSGYAQGEMAQKQVDEARRIEKQRRYDENARRRRMETWGALPEGFLNQYGGTNRA